MIVAHRINTEDDLKVVQTGEAIEFDVRDSNGECIVQHDAFQSGLQLETFFKLSGNRFFIVNIKSEGIEHKVLETLAKFKYDNFFLLDCSFPKIRQLSKENERRIAVRLSEYESIETVLSLANEVEWVWVDSFSQFSLTYEIAKRIKDAGLKICLVSPDLQKQPERIQEYIEKCLKDTIFLDAVCCKIANKPLWESYYNKMKKEFGLLIHHQGYTDIVNSTALISYYASRYKTLYMIVRNDALDIFNFIARAFDNIVFIGAPFPKWHEYVKASIQAISQGLNNIKIQDEDMHLIGLDDVNRNGIYKSAFCQCTLPSVRNGEAFDFWKKFYYAYDIPYIVRINYFEIRRNFAAEQALFQRIVKKQPYILTHFVEEKGKTIRGEEEEKLVGLERYELHKISPSFFDAIELLKQASEIHLIDSVWAAVCYHLDAKYRLLKDIPIKVHCIRKYEGMFLEPVRLNNWTFISY